MKKPNEFSAEHPLDNLKEIGLLGAFHEVNKVQAEAIKNGDLHVASIVNHVLMAFYKVGPNLAEENPPQKLATITQIRF